MRILYFHQHFTTPDVGGGTRSYEFSKKLIEKGHNVTMVCGKTRYVKIFTEDTAACCMVFIREVTMKK